MALAKRLGGASERARAAASATRREPRAAPGRSPCGAAASNSIQCASSSMCSRRVGSEVAGAGERVGELGGDGGDEGGEGGGPAAASTSVAAWRRCTAHGVITT